jgi:hypothetical protein
MDANESIQESFVNKTEAKAALKAWRREMSKKICGAKNWFPHPGNSEMAAAFELIERDGHTSLSESRWIVKETWKEVEVSD